MYFCRRCGHEWSKQVEESPAEYNGEIPEGYYLVKGYRVPSRIVPSHLRPLPKTTRGKPNG